MPPTTVKVRRSFTVRPPFSKVTAPPPLMSEHADAVLAEAGYAPAEIAALRAAGTVL